jgi:hypothetical protein
MRRWLLAAFAAVAVAVTGITATGADLAPQPSVPVLGIVATGAD